MRDGGPTASVSSSGRPDASERKHSPSGALADVSMVDNPSTWLVNPTPNIANYYSIVPEAAPVIDPLVASLRDCLLPPLLRVAEPLRHLLVLRGDRCPADCGGVPP